LRPRADRFGSASGEHPTHIEAVALLTWSSNFLSRILCTSAARDAFCSIPSADGVEVWLDEAGDGVSRDIGAA
jgi:hypothetical protein